MARLRVTTRLTTPDDIVFVAKNLRRQDKIEMQAMQGEDVNIEATLQHSVSITEEPVTVMLDTGVVGCILGIAPVLDTKIGVPWLVGTDDIEDYGREFVCMGRELVEKGLEKYDLLCNYVDARNLRSIEWLKRIGFEVQAPTPFGKYGLPFHLFIAQRAVYM